MNRREFLAAAAALPAVGLVGNSGDVFDRCSWEPLAISQYAWLLRPEFGLVTAGNSSRWSDFASAILENVRCWQCASGGHILRADTAIGGAWLQDWQDCGPVYFNTLSGWSCVISPPFVVQGTARRLPSGLLQYTDLQLVLRPEAKFNLRLAAE